jgi:hypothetical protein
MTLVSKYPRAVNVKMTEEQLIAVTELARTGNLSIAGACREFITAGMVARGVKK